MQLKVCDLLFLCFLGFFQSCNIAKSEFTEEEINKRTYSDALPEVDIAKVEPNVFFREFVSNGVLEARNKADLYFKVSALITTIPVKNGTFVRQGDVLALLDDHEFQLQAKNAQIEYDHSLVELQSEIIMYGDELKDTILVDKPRLKYLKIKSGFEKAKLALEESKYKNTQTKLRAPFSGVVANLKAKPDNLSETGKVFCTVLDNRVFEVVFPVLESEIDMVGIGQLVDLYPYSHIDTIKYKGKISEINPAIDQHGMIEVKATVNNGSGRLLDGMRVRVVTKKAFGNQLIIPKEALLLRDGRKVVFTFIEKDSTSYWNYVDIGLENTNSYTVTSGLKSQDLVIVKGNLNLAHESKVKIME